VERNVEPSLSLIPDRSRIAFLIMTGREGMHHGTRLLCKKIFVPSKRGRFFSCAVLLLMTMLPHRSDGGLSGIKVLWMNNDKEKKTSNIGALSATKSDVAPVGDCSGIFDDTTDRLLQDAIRNIDQLTSVARKLSSENMHSLLTPSVESNQGQSAQRMDSMSTPAIMQSDRPVSSVPPASTPSGKCRLSILVLDHSHFQIRINRSR
jgi:hypothetical protein